MVLMNPLPSSRLWWSFTKPPSLVVKIVPLVGDTSFGFQLVSDVLKKRIDEIVANTIVFPNMEDIAIFGCEVTGTVDHSLDHQTSDEDETQDGRKDTAQPLLESMDKSVRTRNDASILTDSKTASNDVLNAIASAATVVPSLSLSPSLVRRTSMLATPSLASGASSPLSPRSIHTSPMGLNSLMAPRPRGSWQSLFAGQLSSPRQNDE
jgi:hypothetical protein